MSYLCKDFAIIYCVNINFVRMRKYLFLLICAIMAGAMTVSAKGPEAVQEIDALPHKVENPELCDMKGNPINLPQWGEKNLLIFFVDPDSFLGGNKNKKFADEMQANQRAAGDNIYGFGIVNTADTAVFPNLIRAIVHKRVVKEAGAEAFDDRYGVLAKSWGLGDCNNKFAIMIVSKEGELVYCHKEEFTEEDKEQFYQFVEAYK